MLRQAIANTFAGHGAPKATWIFATAHADRNFVTLGDAHVNPLPAPTLATPIVAAHEHADMLPNGHHVTLGDALWLRGTDAHEVCGNDGALL